MIEGRIAKLQRDHEELSKRIEVLIAEKAPDLYVSRLKKLKLTIKDELHDLLKY